jgi:predicted lipoprotein with Yx(FWY)xxD motif
MPTTRSTSFAPRAALIATAAAVAMLAFLQARPAASHTTATKRPVVATATTGLGRILVDSRGHTLYLFEKDKKGMSACAGNCATYWPPLIATGKPLPRTGVNASLLGTTKRADGRQQVTYHHHPLYTFAKDTNKGQTNGEELDAFGAAWYAISPAGAKVDKANDDSHASSPPINDYSGS